MSINGVRLTSAQAMTVRVAIDLFTIDLRNRKNSFGPAERAYQRRR